MGGQPHSRLVDQPAIGFKLFYYLVDAVHLSIPAVTRSIALLLEAQVVKEVSADSGIKVASIFLPHEFILKLLAVAKRGIVHCRPNLLERQQVMADVGREHGGTAPTYR